MTRDAARPTPLPMARTRRGGGGVRRARRLAARSGLASALASALVASGLAAACSDTGPDPASRSAAVAAPGAARALAASPERRAAPPARGLDTETRVLAISVDGLSAVAVRRLGAERLPTLHRLMREGASTLEARTAHERTETLPNHATMLTGRRVDAEHGGHGVTWNDDSSLTVQDGAGHPVASVFDVVRRAGGSTALFSTKTKFDLFEHSWPRAIVRFRVDEEQERLMRTARRDLVRHRRAFTFLHVSLPDLVGHAEGYQTPSYDDAVATTDRWLGRLLAAVERRPALRRHLVVVLTADHGGRGTTHADATEPVNYRVPFVVWGAGVRRGGLYDLDDDYRHPGRGRPDYTGRQPVRNGDLANLATRALGLRPVPGSEIGRAERLAAAVLR